MRIALALALALAALVVAAGPARSQALSPVAEAAWVSAVQNMKTADGFSVLQVLQYAEKMRSAHFKTGGFLSAYNGADGQPEGVSTDYWIGDKRSEDESFSITFEVMVLDGTPVAFYAKTPDRDSATEAVMSGREGLIRFVDERYHQNCIDANSGLKFC